MLIAGGMTARGARNGPIDSSGHLLQACWHLACWGEWGGGGGAALHV